MKIHNVNNFINYNGNAKPVKHEETIKNKNYDVIEINKNSKDENNFELRKIKNDMVSDIKKETSNVKLEKIKESINNNTYQINVDEVVKKLLDR